MRRLVNHEGGNQQQSNQWDIEGNFENQNGRRDMYVQVESLKGNIIVVCLIRSIDEWMFDSCLLEGSVECLLLR